MSSEISSTKQPKGNDKAPESQYNATGLFIQELLKSVKGFQASLEILSAKVEGNGKLTFINKLLWSYITVTRSILSRFAAGK